MPRKGLKRDFLDPAENYIGGMADQAPGETPRRRKAEPKPPTPKRQTVTFHLPVDLIERARDTVYALSGPPEQLTLAGVVSQALERELERIEKKHNKGKPFPSRKGPLRTGRPLTD